MNKFNLLLAPVLLAPGILLAQAPALEESIYVVRTQNKIAVPGEVCAPLLPLLGGGALYSSNTSDLYSVLTKNKNGSFKKTKQKVGTILGCNSELTPEWERVVFQTGDFGSVWQMSLNGKDYTITGASRLRTNPFISPYGFPVPNSGMVLGGSTGTIHKSFAETWPDIVTVGSFSCTWLGDPNQVGGFDDLATCTISLYE